MPSSILMKTMLFVKAKLFIQADGFLQAPESAYSIIAAIDEAVRCKRSCKKKTFFIQRQWPWVHGYGRSSRNNSKKNQQKKLEENEVREKSLKRRRLVVKRSKIFSYIPRDVFIRSFCIKNNENYKTFCFQLWGF